MCVAAGAPLLLPERNRLFDSVDRFPAGSKCSVPMRRARCDADRDVSDFETADTVHRGDTRARVLGGDTLENPPHLLLGQALMRLVVEPLHRLTVGMIADNAQKDANAPRTGMLDGAPCVVQRDLPVGDAAESDGRATRNGRKHVDAIAIPQLARGIDEVSVDG